MQYFEFVAARADTGAVLPSALVTVRLTNTATLAALKDRAGAALGNPMTATASGLAGFAAPNGNYDITITSNDGSYALPIVRNVQFYDLGELDGKVASAAANAEATQDLFDAANMIRADLPGTALAVYKPSDDTIPWRVSGDGRDTFNGSVRTSHQFRPAGFTSPRAGSDYLILTDDAGRGLQVRAQPVVLDGYADDAARYIGAPRRPLDLELVFTTSTVKLAAYAAGYERGVAAATRIPSLSADGRGLVLAYAEARTTLEDGDPKGIVRRRSVSYGRQGSWEAQTMIASDFGVTGPDSVLRNNSFGNPSSVIDPTADPISGGKAVVLVYWRREDIAAAGGLVAPTTDPERTSRIYAFMDDGAQLYDLAGNVKAAPMKRADMFDATATKPNTWGAGSPGPAQGLAHSSGTLYWTIHGAPVGGTPPGRQICLVKLDRATRSIVQVALSPLSLAEPNETSMCELPDGTGRILMSSRVETGSANDNRIRMLNLYDPASNTWDIPRMQVNLPDPQKAGAMCSLTRGPYEPPVIVHANVAMHQSSNQDTLRNLTVRLSWDNGYTWPTGRRVYDSASNGYLQRRADSWGNPVLDGTGKPTSISWHAMTGYSSMAEIAPGVVGILFETRALFADGGDQLGHCAFATLTMNDMMEPRRD